MVKLYSRISAVTANLVVCGSGERSKLFSSFSVC